MKKTKIASSKMSSSRKNNNKQSRQYKKAQNTSVVLKPRIQSSPPKTKKMYAKGKTSSTINKNKTLKKTYFKPNLPRIREEPSNYMRKRIQEIDMKLVCPNTSICLGFNKESQDSIKAYFENFLNFKYLCLLPSFQGELPPHLYCLLNNMSDFNQLFRVIPNQEFIRI